MTLKHGSNGGLKKIEVGVTCLYFCESRTGSFPHIVSSCIQICIQNRYPMTNRKARLIFPRFLPFLICIFAFFGSFHSCFANYHPDRPDYEFIASCDVVPYSYIVSLGISIKSFQKTHVRLSSI